MQFNVVPRTGGLAINRKNRGKRGVRQHNSHSPLTIRFPFLPVGSFSISTGWRSPYTLSGLLGTLVSLVDHLGPNGGSGGGALL